METVGEQRCVAKADEEQSLFQAAECIIKMETDTQQDNKVKIEVDPDILQEYQMKKEADPDSSIHDYEIKMECPDMLPKAEADSPTSAGPERRQNKKSFQCIVCGKSFCDQWALTVHIRTHTGEKPFECKECGQRFAQNSTLSNHFRALHAGDTPHQCTECDKAFVHYSHLIRHQQTHEETNLSNAACAIKHLCSRQIWRYISELTQEKNHISARSVDKDLRKMGL